MSNETFTENEITELRRALNTIEAQAPTGPDYDDVPILTLRTRRGPYRPVLVGLLAAAGVALILLPALLIASGRGEPESELQNPTPATTAGSDVTISAWAVTEVPDSWVDDIAHSGSEFLAYGGGLRSSLTGLAWEQLGAISGEVTVRALVADNEVIIATGDQVIDNTEGRELRSAFWVSPDHGQTWNLVPIDGVVMDIAKTPFGFIAGGFQYGPDSEDFSITHAALWVSNDGLTWEDGASSVDATGESSRIEKVTFDDGLVAFGGRGPHLVQEGSNLDDRPGLQPATWKSNDGMTWTDEAVLSNRIGSLQAVQATPLGILGLSYWSTTDVKDNSAVFVSGDGITWEQIQIDDGAWEYTDVAFSGETIVVTGYQLGSGLPGPVQSRIWTSTDGSEWTPVALVGLPESIRIDQVEITTNSIVIGARSGDDLEHFIAGAQFQPTQ